MEQCVLKRCKEYNKYTAGNNLSKATKRQSVAYTTNVFAKAVDIVPHQETLCCSWDINCIFVRHKLKINLGIIAVIAKCYFRVKYEEQKSSKCTLLWTFIHYLGT